MKDFKFTPEELNFLKGIKIKGTITNEQAVKVENIYKRMDANFTMCTTCTSTIARETNRLLGIAETFVEGSLVDYVEKPIEIVIFSKEDFKGLTAKMIIRVVFELVGVEIKTSPQSKAKIVKEALTLLNK